MNYQNRFTNRAIKAIEYAQYEAQNLERDYIGTEHMLLSLLHEQGGAAYQVLRSMDVDVDALREAVLS